MKSNVFFDCARLKAWFLQEKRDLPWRKDPSPYAVWISEVMLQQTQVVVVIPYFERWMRLFPNIEALALASLEDVIKAWEGLGYYSRARRLHAAAKYLVENFNATLPKETCELEKIKGLGPYTIGAIQSFAFRQKTPAVDGNVLRVLARYFLVEDDIGSVKTIKHIRSLAQSLLPDEEHWIVNEALIELGACYCTKKPKCKSCPVRSSCAAYAQGVAEQLPKKSFKIKTEKLYRSVAIIAHQGHLLVKKEEEGKIMCGLLEFPYFQTTKEMASNNLYSAIKMQLGLDAELVQEMPQVNQSFTRYRVTLYPIYFEALENIKVPGFEWLSLEQIKKQAFSSGHRRIFAEWNRRGLGCHFQKENKVV